MPKKYNKSPITEAVCEFRFSADTQWDLTIPGLVFEKIREKYPNKAEQNRQTIEVKKSDEEGMVQTISADKYVQFSTADKKKLIIVGPRTLLASRLNPYVSWEEFKPDIDRAYKSLPNFADIKGLQRIGLRYINTIVIPEDSVTIENYFEFRPYIGKKSPNFEMNTFIVAYTSSFCDGRDSCKVQLTSGLSDKTGVSTFILDLDYFLVKPEAISKDDAIDWVENAHSQIEEIFEGCLKDSLRKVFGEEV